jgi:hypothetical protein
MGATLLEQIIAHGNRTLSLQRLRTRGYRDLPNWITCADGFKLSVIAGGGAYCSPRPGLSPYDDVPDDYPGPYVAVEVGYPSERPEPWHCTAWRDGYDSHADHDVCDGWQTYAEADTYEDTSVYGRVPVAMVRALVALHGGEA